MRQYKLKKVIRTLERLVLRILVVGLVLLVAGQFVLTNSNLEQKIVTNIPWTKRLLTLGQQYKFNQPAKKVFSSTDYIKFSLQNNRQLKEVKILVNGEKVGNFSQSELKVEINVGDKIAIDARNCEQGLWFRVDALSSDLSSFQSGQQFWLKDEYKVLGKVSRSNKF